MHHYVSPDPDQLGVKVTSTDPEAAVASALAQDRVTGSTFTVRWNLRPDGPDYLFARVTTVTVKGDDETKAPPDELAPAKAPVDEPAPVEAPTAKPAPTEPPTAKPAPEQARSTADPKAEAAEPAPRGKKNRRGKKR